MTVWRGEWNEKSTSSFDKLNNCKVFIGTSFIILSYFLIGLISILPIILSFNRCDAIYEMVLVCLILLSELMQCGERRRNALLCWLIQPLIKGTSSIHFPINIILCIVRWTVLKKAHTPSKHKLSFGRYRIQQNRFSLL